ARKRQRGSQCCRDSAEKNSIAIMPRRVEQSLPDRSRSENGEGVWSSRPQAGPGACEGRRFDLGREIQSRLQQSFKRPGGIALVKPRPFHGRPYKNFSVTTRNKVTIPRVD